jgi:arabinogalactan oligomer/maltooligosaccharide transport system substrate-binding protein
MKKLLTSVVSLLSVLMLASCHQGSGSSKESGTSVVTNETFTIKVGSDQNVVSWVAGKAQTYLRANGFPNVTVEAYQLSESKADSITDWSAGPDVYAYASDKILNLVHSGALAKVTSKNLTALNTMLGEDVMASVKIGDNYYGYPYTTNTFFMYYNGDAVTAEQAKTMDGLIAAAAAKGTDYKVAYNLKNSWYGIPFLSSYGARFNVSVSDSGEVTGITSDFAEKALPAAKLMKSYLRNGNVTLIDGDQVSPSDSNKTVAQVTGSWKNDAYSKDVTNLKAAALPKIDDDHYAYAFMGYKDWGVNPQAYGSDVNRAAADQAVAMYFCGKEFQLDYFKQYSNIPLNKEAVKDPSLATNQIVPAIQAEIPHSIPQSVVPSNVWSAYDAFYTTLSSADTDTDEEIKAALKDFDTALQKTENK